VRYSSPFSADVEIPWSCAPAPPLYPHVMHIPVLNLVRYLESRNFETAPLCLKDFVAQITFVRMASGEPYRPLAGVLQETAVIRLVILICGVLCLGMI